MDSARARTAARTAVVSPVMEISIHAARRKHVSENGTEAVSDFARILGDAGIITTVRKTRGDDIDAACGQLAGATITGP